jgi:nucleoid-associated protein YgaU
MGAAVMHRRPSGAVAVPDQVSRGITPSSSGAALPPTATVAFAMHARKRGDRAHVVRPGESLWSVAKDVLGAGASSAQMAREVNRLWELNKDSIGTGDPDLLMVGTRLRLR